MESHSLCLPGTAASVVSLRNEMATAARGTPACAKPHLAGRRQASARKHALEARNDKLSDAFAFVYAQSPLAILAFNHL